MRPDTTADWYLYVAIVRILLIAFLNLLPSESSQINYVEFMSFIVPRQGNSLNPRSYSLGPLHNDNVSNSTAYAHALI